MKPHSIAKGLKSGDFSTSGREILCGVTDGGVENDDDFDEVDDEVCEAREERGWYGIPVGGTSAWFSERTAERWFVLLAVSW